MLGAGSRNSKRERGWIGRSQTQVAVDQKFPQLRLPGVPGNGLRDRGRTRRGGVVDGVLQQNEPLKIQWWLNEGTEAMGEKTWKKNTDQNKRQDE